METRIDEVGVRDYRVFVPEAVPPAGPHLRLRNAPMAVTPSRREGCPRKQTKRVMSTICRETLWRHANREFQSPR